MSETKDYLKDNIVEEVQEKENVKKEIENDKSDNEKSIDDNETDNNSILGELDYVDEDMESK